MSELAKIKSEGLSEAPVKDAGVNVGDMFTYNSGGSNSDVVRILGIEDDGKYIRYTYEDLADVMTGKFKKAKGVYSSGEEYDQTITKDSMERYYKKILH